MCDIQIKNATMSRNRGLAQTLVAEKIKHGLNVAGLRVVKFVVATPIEDGYQIDSFLANCVIRFC